MFSSVQNFSLRWGYSTNHVIIDFWPTGMSIQLKYQHMYQETYFSTAYLRHSSRLFCWTETKSILSARPSRELAVFCVSSFTWSWWLLLSFCISDINQVNTSIPEWKTTHWTHFPSANRLLEGTWTCSTALEIWHPMLRMQPDGSQPFPIFYHRPAWPNRRIWWRLRSLELHRFC